MRVHVSQSVELEDVPKRVVEMLEEYTELDVSEHVHYIIKVLQSNVTFHKTGFCVEKIAELRSKLAELDFSLQDCTNILAGYADVLQKQAPTPAQEAPEVVEQVDDDDIVEGEDG